MNHRWIGAVVALGVSVGALVGAARAAPPPPRELLHARAIYALAAAGEATPSNPSALHEARVQLATAEQRLEAAGQNLKWEKKSRTEAETGAREALDKLFVANTLSVKDEPRGTVITVPSGVLFASGKADLLSGAQSTLEPIAEALSHEQDHRIVIEEQTRSQASDFSSVELSRRRAQVVRDFFISHGVLRDHIAATDVGETRPSADTAMVEGRPNYPRAVIVIQSIEAHSMTE